MSRSPALPPGRTPAQDVSADRRLNLYRLFAFVGTRNGGEFVNVLNGQFQSGAGGLFGCDNVANTQV
jgi:hypothetical protein